MYVDDDGRIVRTVDGGERREFAVDALPDARLAALGEDRYALYGDRTERYKHGALGDTVEGGSLVVFDGATSEVVTRTSLDPPAVYEGQSPLAADLDGNGDVELLTTVSDSELGARIVVFDETGERRATGPIHGSGWRHQLCVAPFAKDGRPELAVVRQPHVGHVLEFYRFDGNELAVTATLDGFSSHAFGSHNLDGGLAADLDDDGSVELLVPTTDRRTLRAVERTADGARVDWGLALDGALRTNVAGVALGDGRVSVGAGTDSGVLVWQG
ncbi:hypothetical protein VB773_15980 [Haloarculaceae archaeon H-GB2-1]|nr:hypothetical protein [Haloarculaceae archaeon H-GB11]MEA5408914.1 hypothetical protein [Haloarculaceae archaeon H-GB2-1]